MKRGKRLDCPYDYTIMPFLFLTYLYHKESAERFLKASGPVAQLSNGKYAVAAGFELGRIKSIPTCKSVLFLWPGSWLLLHEFQ